MEYEQSRCLILKERMKATWLQQKFTKASSIQQMESYPHRFGHSDSQFHFHLQGIKGTMVVVQYRFYYIAKFSNIS